MAKKEKKRPKYIVDLVNDVNASLRRNKQKDIYSELAWWLVDYLTKNGWYKGHNFYIDSTLEINGEMVTRPALAGSADPDKYEYVQIY